MTMKSNQSYPNLTVAKLRKKFVILDELQHYPQVTHMIFLTLGVYQIIIDNDNHKRFKIVTEHPIYKVYKGRRGIS